MRNIFFTGLLLFVIAFAFGQLPETDIWHFKIKNEKEQWVLGEGKNITSRKGYDNQPCFTPDNKRILYVSIREDSQADIYSYDISKALSLQLTKTKVSEYSPMYLPNQQLFSCVVVEEGTTQRLWLYNLDGTVKGCYNNNIDSIGYYSWLSKDSLLYYKLTDPHSLRAFYENSNEDVWLANNSCRAFKKTKGNSFLYAIKDSVSIEYRVYNTLIKRSDVYAYHKSKSEDFIWSSTFGLVKSEGAQLLKYNERLNAWETLFDFSPFGIKKITRFAFDSKNKQLVIVDNT